jgi:hypothetical protein
MHFIAPEINDPSVLTNILNSEQADAVAAADTATTTTTGGIEATSSQQQSQIKVGDKHSTAIDMYAFGMVALEVCRILNFIFYMC